MKYDKEAGSVEANSGDTVKLVYQEKPNESLTISVQTKSQGASKDTQSQDQSEDGPSDSKHFNITLYNPSSKDGKTLLSNLRDIIGPVMTKQLVDKINTLPIYPNNDSKLVLEGKAQEKCSVIIKSIQVAQTEDEIQNPGLYDYINKQIKQIQKNTQITEELLNKEKNVNFHK